MSGTVTGPKHLLGCLAGMLALSTGCNAIRNGWLDPTVVGDFKNTRATEIRSSLTLEDPTSVIPGATLPTPDDLRLYFSEYPISGGDTLEIEINELRQRQTPFLAQVPVAAAGYVNLPVVGRVQAAGLTVPEFEDGLRDALRSRNILVDPDVTVNPLFLQRATYSVFGIGVSAANNAPLRAGTFPIRRPDLRVLEAINQVGGLNEFVAEIFIFRSEEPPVEERPEAYAPTPDDDPRFSFDDPDATPPGVLAAPQQPSPVDEPDATSQRIDLIRAVTRPDEPPIEDTAKEVNEIPDPAAEIIADTEADPTTPYIWIDDEFVPNPAFQAPEAGVPPISAEAASPAVNWSRIAGDSNYRIIHIPAEPLRSGDPAWNIYVRAGDTIRIVSGEIGIYYVMGQVNRVGSYSFNAEAVTLKAAIASAGGLSPLAWPDRCTVYRRLGQREQMIQVNLDRIFAGAEPDFLIKRGDIINVGTHPFAPFLQRIRALTLPNIVNNVGYSFTYARNFADIDSFSVQQNPRNEPDRFPNLFR